MSSVQKLNEAYEYLRNIGKIHTKKDLAELMSANRVNVSKAFAGDRKYLTDSFLIRLNSTFGNIFNEEWLLGDSSNMLKERLETELSPIPLENNGEYFTENNNGVKFYDLGNGKYRMVVRLVPFAAYGKFANECDSLEPDKDSWEEESFETDTIVHGKYLAFEVKGDSMDDGSRGSFEEGDRILVRELDKIHWTEGLRYKDYPFWVVVFDSSVLIKQIINQDINKGTVTFHSLNKSPEYSDFTLDIDRIRGLYYVLQKKPKIVKF